MKFFIGKASTLHSHHHQFLLYIVSPQSNYMAPHSISLLNNYYPNFITKRWLSTGTESAQSEFTGLNAYELLGVSETSSFAEIKVSFRKLAKETHPDLLPHSTPNSSSTSKQFVDILAAYEVMHFFPIISIFSVILIFSLSFFFLIF